MASLRLSQPIASQPGCPVGADNRFGPRVDPSCRSFDFTLVFEDVVFLLVPAAVFLILLPFRLTMLVKRPVKLRSVKLLGLKLVMLATLIGLHVAYLVLVLLAGGCTNFKTNWTLPSEILTLVAILGAVLLSFLESQRSVKPSDLLVLYFTFTTILSIPRLRTLWAYPWVDVLGLQAVWASIFSLTVLSTLAESIGKARSSRHAGEKEYYSSEQVTNFWGRSFFIWVIPFFNVGYKKRLTMADIPRPDCRLEEMEAWTRLDAAWMATTTGKHRLLRATARAYWPSILKTIPPRLALSVFTFCQPFLFAAAVANLEKGASRQGQGQLAATYDHALVGAFVLVYTGIAVCRALYQRQRYRLQAQIRAGLISKIYRDMTKLRKADIQDSTAISLMGTNVDRIVSESGDVHEVWASFLEIGIATWLLARQLGVAAILPVVICLLSVIGASRIAALFGPAQMAWITRVQTRVSVTAEVMGEIKTVKMLGLSSVVSSIITRLREEELRASEGFRKLLIGQILVGNIPTLAAPYGTFLVYATVAKVKNDESILAEKAFTSLSLIALTTSPLLKVCEALPACNQAMVCFRNVERFCSKAGIDGNGNPDGLSSPEHKPEHGIELADTKPPVASVTVSLAVSAQKRKADTDVYVQPILPQATVQQPKYVPSQPLYSFKEAWVGWSSARAADVLSDTSERLEDAQKLCTLQGLTVDIAPGLTGVTGAVGSGKSTLLSTLIGETILVSGDLQMNGLDSHGAVAYCSQVPWVMDDTVRSNVIGSLPFDEQWYDFAVDVCRLGTDISRMSKGDQTLCGSKGSSLSGGQRQRVALARAVYSRARIVVLDDVTSGLDSKTSAAILDRLFGRSGYFRQARITVILATQQEPLLARMDHVIHLEKGRVTDQGPLASIKKHLAASIEEADKPDSPVADAVEQGLRSDEAIEEKPLALPDSSHADSDDDPLEDEETTKQRTNGSWEVYSYYAQSAGAVSIVLWAFFTVVGAAFGSVTTIWINKWTEANTSEPNQNVGYYLGIYALFILVSTAGTAAECWTFFVKIISDTALTMHNHLLEATLGAPIDFFQSTDTGSIVNRFSQDMDLIDMTLPAHAIQFTTGFASCLVQIIVICVVGKYFTITVPVLAISLFLVQRYYLRTSRQLRLIDIEAKAPIYKLFLESIQGMPTVRSFCWTRSFQQRNADALNLSQRPLYMLYSIQQWLALVLDLIVGAIAVVIVGTATAALHSKGASLSGGDVGVALVTVLQFSSLLGQSFQAWTRLETSIGAVARVKQHVKDTPQEAQSGSKQPELSTSVPDKWPSKGMLCLQNIEASYGSKSSAILRDVNLDISPGEKVVLCGSSGSGKSSLVMTILQMTSVRKGSIVIDDIDISTVNKSLLRQRINIIPQEALFLPGTLKFNLDPLSSGWSDETTKNVLRRVGLWNKAEEAGGIYATFKTSDWSHGEKQLLCLARALLRPSQLLILDEAMSSVDAETEALMQAIIDEDFRACTVISVLHRFTHVYHYDRVVMLQHGRLVESGSPEELLGPENKPSSNALSAFSKLYHANR